MSRTARLRQPLRKTAKWGGLAATLLLCVVWLGSTWCYVDWQARRPGIGLMVSRGTIALAWSERPLRPVLPPNPPFERFGITIGFHPQMIRLWDWRLVLGDGGICRASFPLWLPLLLSAGITTLAWRADLLARRRARIGKCIACGYPLDGLPPESPCPECGRNPKAQSAAAPRTEDQTHGSQSLPR